MVTNRKPKEMHPAHDHSQQPVFRRNHPSRQAGKQPGADRRRHHASNVSTTGNATTPDASIALNADATPVADVPRVCSAHS